MLGIVSNIRLLILVGSLVGGWFLWGVANNWISEFGMAHQNLAMCKRDKALIESRVESLRVLKDRRDEAIAASRCKSQIQHWIKNPDEITKPFNPFNQLDTDRN